MCMSICLYICLNGFFFHIHMFFGCISFNMTHWLVRHDSSCLVQLYNTACSCMQMDSNIHISFLYFTYLHVQAECIKGKNEQSCQGIAFLLQPFLPFLFFQKYYQYSFSFEIQTQLKLLQILLATIFPCLFDFMGSCGTSCEEFVRSWISRLQTKGCVEAFTFPFPFTLLSANELCSRGWYAGRDPD